jgi:hypothetical protein
MASVSHPGKLLVIRFNVIVDSDILLVGMVPMRAASLLLQRLFP